MVRKFEPLFGRETFKIFDVKKGSYVDPELGELIKYHVIGQLSGLVSDSKDIYLIGVDRT